jgi:hypothetical protein
MKLSTLDNSDSDSDGDSDTDSDLKLRISCKRLKTDALHKTSETSSWREEIPDLIETNEYNSIEPSIIPTFTTIPSKQKAKQKPKQKPKQKAKQESKQKEIGLKASKAINHEDDEILRLSAFQNGLDELPFPHIPVVPTPKPPKPSIVKKTITWDPKQLFPNNKVYPPKEVKEKRPRSPPYNYILLKSNPDNVALNNKFSRPTVDTIYDDDDDDDNDDHHADCDDFDYQYDDYNILSVLKH